MSKTIEELAKQFTDELFAEDDLTDFDTQTEKNDAYVTCMAFGNYLMEKPLSFRLTAEEKEQTRFAHKAAKVFAETTKPMDAEVFKGQYLLLESIFGSDFFKEGE